MAGTVPVAYEWLMPLAPWEPADRLFKALESLHRQTWPARRLVVSVDGKLSDQLAEVLRQSPLPLHIVQSPYWQGTGPTLAAGLFACECEWVLRADADDQSVPSRAQRQLTYLLDHPDLAVLGSQLREYSDEHYKNVVRCVPLASDKIRGLLRWRNPINHPTVALNRNRILLAGSYRSVLNFEDWDLWLRLCCQGATFQNLPDILVNAQVGRDHLQRRHGFTYAKREFAFLVNCYHDRLISGFQALILMIMRLPWRILPMYYLASVMNMFRVNSITKLNR